jgi:hypothetical protein
MADIPFRADFNQYIMVHQAPGPGNNFKTVSDVPFIKNKPFVTNNISHFR